jgi:Holliday junction resolvase RusA-like endonuclease
MKTVVELPYLPDPDLNPNKRLHHYGVAKARSTAKEMMGYTLKTIDLPDQPYEYAKLKIEFIAKDRIRRDLDNLMASCKAYIDAFVAGVIAKEAKTIFTITKVEINART